MPLSFPQAAEGIRNPSALEWWDGGKAAGQMAGKLRAHCGGKSRQGKTLESAKKHRCTGVIQKAAYVSCNGGKREAVDIPPSQIFQIGMILQGPLLAHTDFPLMTVERKTNP
jgi:hypothetical protein